MYRRLCRIVLAVVAAAFVLTAHAQDTARMDQIVREFVDGKQFMGTVLVARGDEIVFDQAYGRANLEWNIPNSPTTRFKIGSITKQFTGVSVLLLEERGKLNLDDPIKKYYGEAPAAWDAITLKHLLTHTSGIPNFTSFPEFSKFKHFPAKLEDSIALFKDKPLEFSPGEKMAYCNSGYILLGYVIEKVAGVSYPEFLQANILTPLGMKDSGYDSSTRVIEHKAAGYTLGSDKEMGNAEFAHMSIPHAAGGMYSTTGDLLRWQRGVYGGKLLSAASLEKFTTPFKDGYALGVGVTTEKRKSYAHGGGIEGFNTHLMYYPDTQVTVVALSNVNGAAPGAITGKLGAVMHGEKVTLISERKEIRVPRKVLQKYVGTYAVTPKVNAVVSLDGDQLMTQVGGQERMPVFAESPTRFFLKRVDAQWEFQESGGKVTQVVIYQGGREIKAPRAGDTVAAGK